jgi:putative transposase
MAEAFVKTIKRDYVRVNPTPDAVTVLAQLRGWFTDYNFVHAHSALQSCSIVRLRSSDRTK